MTNTTPNDMLPTIQRAQHEIVAQLVRWELSLAELYRLFGEHFPETLSLWRALEKEEVFHAKTLDALHGVIDEGFLLHNIGEYLGEQVIHEIELVQKEIARVRAGHHTQYTAIMTAMSVEGSLLDSKFYETVTCDSPAFKRVAEIMMQETQRHLERIESVFSSTYKQK